jgi:methylmalonyl-CoA mutase C-terminal domain/subunit
MPPNTENYKQQGVGPRKNQKPRILVARFSLDGHDRGILTVMHALRNAGMEIVYIFFSDPKEIVKVAIEEAVDVIGVTSSQGEHLLVCSRLMDELNKQKTDIPVIIGGVIPSMDVQKLLDMGIKRVFGPGSKPADAVSFISRIMKRIRSRA